MPYMTMKDGDEWCVRRKGPDGEPMGDSMGCHASEDEANAQITALNASVTELDTTPADDPPVALVQETVTDTIISEFRGKVPNVPFAPGVDKDALLEGDDNPMFLTLPLSELGKVSKNGLLHDEDLSDTLLRQINAEKPGGIRGHISDAQRDTAYPLTNIFWIGAMRDQRGVTWGKGYIPRTQPELREEYRILKAVGGKVATSIYGKAVRELAAENPKQWRARNFNLEQIDLAPYKRAALPGSGEFAITAEMESAADQNAPIQTEVAEQEVNMNKDQIIAELTVTDLPETLRNLVIAEYESARVAELETTITAKDQRIAELETATTAKDTRIAELEGVTFETDLDAKIAELTAWQTNTEDGKETLTKLRAEIKARSLGKLGTVREMATAETTVKELIEGDLKWLVEMARDKLAGPAVVIPRTQEPASTAPTADQIADARAKTGI